MADAMFLLIYFALHSTDVKFPWRLYTLRCGFLRCCAVVVLMLCVGCIGVRCFRSRYVTATGVIYPLN